MPYLVACVTFRLPTPIGPLPPLPQASPPFGGSTLDQKSGSSMSIVAAASSATKAAFEKAEGAPPPLAPPSSRTTAVVSRCKMESMSAAWKRSYESSSSRRKMSRAPHLRRRSTSRRSAALPAAPDPPAPSPLWPLERACSRPSFRLAVSRRAASYVLRVHSRKTLTDLCCPMRWLRAIAWMSFCGFQSESKMMTVSAAVRLMPTPPARVERRNAKMSEPGREKRSIAAWR